MADAMMLHVFTSRNPRGRCSAGVSTSYHGCDIWCPRPSARNRGLPSAVAGLACITPRRCMCTPPCKQARLAPESRPTRGGCGCGCGAAGHSTVRRERAGRGWGLRNGARKSLKSRLYSRQLLPTASFPSSFPSSADTPQWLVCPFSKPSWRMYVNVARANRSAVCRGSQGSG